MNFVILLAGSVLPVTPCRLTISGIEPYLCPSGADIEIRTRTERTPPESKSSMSSYSIISACYKESSSVAV